MSGNRPGHAVVLGASMAGILAAHVLSKHVDAVTVVERDVLPDGPEHRRGVPQGRHAHLLWSNGARIIEALLPGTTDALLAAGARRIGFPEDLVTLTTQGWQHRFPATQFAVLGSRPLVDHVIRQQVLPNERITVRQATEAVELTGGAGRVTGVLVREDGGEPTRLDADLVIDATGRASRLGPWLDGLGLPAPAEDAVDAGIGYSTRIFAAPPGATAGFPAVNVASDHEVGKPGRFGVVYPLEGGRWIVTLSVTRGAELPTDEDDFLGFAERLRHPMVAALLRDAQPLTPVFVSRSTANRRRYPERLPEWPEGLVIVGDSLTHFNPVYGHGMSSAARCAAALDEQLGRADASGTRRLQEAVSAVVDDPWILAATTDVGYVDCRTQATDPRLIGADTQQRMGYARSISGKSIRSPAICEVVTDVMSLNLPPSELGSNRFLSLAYSAELYPELTGPPVRPEELDIVGLDARSLRPGLDPVRVRG